MTINLFVGDIYEDLAKIAKEFDSLAYLLTNKNVDSIFNPATDNQTVYTSIADISDLKLFDKICNKADIIFYYPPKQWSDTAGPISKQQQWTETILAFYSQYNKVQNFNKLSNGYDFLNQDFLLDKRKNNQQFWAVGCSISYGTGVKKSQTWKEIISKKLNLPYSDLTREGSSIIWQSDQILRSDIRKGDLVLWGVTSHNRLPVINNGELYHLNSSLYESSHNLHKKFPLDLLDNNSLYWHNMLAIQRVSNFCQKIGANLIALGLVHDWNNLYYYYNVPEFFQLQYWPHSWIDLGDDNYHPGPNHHQHIAEKFFEYIQNLPLE